MHQFRSPMTLRASKPNNHENRCPISLSKLGESSCSDFMKSCVSSQELRSNTEQKVPLRLNSNCDNIIQPSQLTKTPVKCPNFSNSCVSSSCKPVGER